MVNNKPESINWRYLFQETILILGGSYLLFIAGTKASQLNPNILIINATFFSLLVVFLLLKSRVHFGIETPLLAMLAVMFLASLTSIDPRRSLSEFGLVVSAVCLFIGPGEWIRRGLPRELVVKALLVIGSIFMIFSWIEVGSWYISWLDVNPKAFIPNVNFRLNNPNIIAMLVNVWLMLAVTWFISSKKKGTRFILSIWIVSAAGVLFLSSSRGGWMATVSGLACIVMVHFTRNRALWRSLWQKITQNRIFTILIIVAFVIGVALAGFLMYRQLSHPTHGTRSEFWTPAINAFFSAPILGKGPFTFISAYLQTNSVPTMVPFDYAHSIYMDLLSGAGMAGLITFIWLMIGIIRILLNQIRQETGIDWAVSLGALAALVTFLVHGIVDSTHASEPISLWNLCIVFGAGLYFPQRGENQRNWEKAFKVILALAAASLTWFAWWTLLPMQNGVEKANSGDWKTAVSLFREAIQRDPSMAATYQQAGYVESILARDGDDQALQTAIRDFELTVQIDPYWGLNHANLAALYNASGKLDQAREEFKEAVRLAPRSVIYQLNLGTVQERLGDLTDAEIRYRTALSLKPDWSGARFWRMNPFRKNVLNSWMESQQIATNDLQNLEKAVQTNPDAKLPYISLAKAYMDNGMLTEAEKTINLADFSTGSNEQAIESAWLRAEISAAKGDFPSAGELGEKTLDAVNAYGIFGPGTPGNQIYNAYMFRRPASKIDFVPQLEVIRWPDKWGRRALKLAGWLEQSGNPAEAEKWRALVAENIPDLPAE